MKLDTCVYFGELIDQSYINSVLNWYQAPPTIYPRGRYTHVSGFNAEVFSDVFIPHDLPSHSFVIDGGRDADGNQIVADFTLTDSDYSRNQKISTDLMVVGKWSDSKYFGRTLGKSDSVSELVAYTDRLVSMNAKVAKKLNNPAGQFCARKNHLKNIPQPKFAILSTQKHKK